MYVSSETIYRSLFNQARGVLTKERLAHLRTRRRMRRSEYASTAGPDVAAYFCDPQSPWQRGTNENTNGLLRQYFPTDTDLSTYIQADLDAIALKLKPRPRKSMPS